MKKKRVVLIAITVITLLAASVIFCACDTDGNKEEKPPEPNYYTVEFAVFLFEGGHIEGQAVQEIQEGGSTEKIKAIADEFRWRCLCKYPGMLRHFKDCG